jgi:hypothetical protein
MSITTYSELITAVGNWLGGRGDLDTFIPDFITLFEAAANRRLRTARMIAEADISFVDFGFGFVPNDYIAFHRAIWLGSPSIELEYITETFYSELNTAGITTGRPRYITFSGDAFFTIPTDTSSNVRLNYFKAIPPLATNTTNWLFASHPDAYLFGALAEASDFTDSNNQIQKWIARRDAIFGEIELQDKRRQGIGSIRTFAPTP